MKRILATTALVLATLIPAGAQGPGLSVPHTQFQLANGLNVILHRDASVPVASV